MSAAVGADHKRVTFGCKLATLFGTYCDDGLNAVIGAWLYTQVTDLGAVWQ